jgi:hypothetical protein
MDSFHMRDASLRDPGLHGSGRAERFRRDAQLHRLLKGAGATPRRTMGRRLAHVLGRR